MAFHEPSDDRVHDQVQQVVLGMVEGGGHGVVGIKVKLAVGRVGVELLLTDVPQLQQERAHLRVGKLGCRFSSRMSLQVLLSCESAGFSSVCRRPSFSRTRRFPRLRGVQMADSGRARLLVRATACAGIPIGLWGGTGCRPWP